MAKWFFAALGKHFFFCRDFSRSRRKMTFCCEPGESSQQKPGLRPFPVSKSQYVSM